MIVVACSLWALATLDAAFIGFRVAAGLSLLIDKRAYYRRAMKRGAVAGQVPVAVVAVLAGCLYASASEPIALATELRAAGTALIGATLPFALVVALGVALRTIRSVDVRSMASILIFGPLTLLRPAVVLLGGAMAWRAVSLAQTRILLGVVIMMMLGFEALYSRIGTGSQEMAS